MGEVGVLVIIFFAAAVQSTTGFGFGLVAMGLLPLIIPELLAIPLVAVVGLSTELLIAWRLRRHISWPHARPLLAGVALGAPAGLIFLAAADPRWIAFALGLFLVLYAGASLTIRAPALARGVGDRWGYLAGAVGGVLGGAFNTGGPPLVVWSALKRWEKERAIATLQALFIVTGLIAIGGHVAAGRVTVATARDTALALPAVALGTWIGGHLSHRVDQALFRRLLLGMLLLVGTFYVVKALS